MQSIRLYVVKKVNFLGVIFYELLKIIPADNWTKHIYSIREGGFLQDNSLLDHEKALLGVLLAQDAADRPSDVQDVIEVAEILLDNYKGLSI